MKIISDIISVFIVVAVSGGLMYWGYLGIFKPMKIVDYYSNDNTAFMRRVKAEGLRKRDLLQYKFVGMISIIMGGMILLGNISYIIHLFS